MEIVIESEPVPRIRWTLPVPASYVACAVFTCNPLIGAGDELSPTETSLPKITNFDACSLLFYVEPASISSVVLSTGNVHLDEQPICDAAATYRRAYEQTSVGCWAYGETDIVAASELVNVSPSLLAKVVPGFPQDANCAGEQMADCYDPVEQFFGVCVFGVCRPRCMSERDCQLAAAKHLGEPLTGPCTWSCVPVEDSIARVCVPTTP